MLIENNNKLNSGNSQCERILQTLDFKAIRENIITSEISDDLQVIKNTINLINLH